MIFSIIAQIALSTQLAQLALAVQSIPKFMYPDEQDRKIFETHG